MKLNHLFRKGFYKYQYQRIRRKRPLDYVFLDWRTLLMISGLFLIGVIVFFPSKLQFAFPDNENRIYILEALLRIVSIFIGISFSIIILSFNVFFRYFGRYAFLDFFKLRSAKVCITLLISTIIVLLYSIYFLKESPDTIRYNNFLFLFAIVLSSISFFSIFPYFINLLRDSQNRNHITHLFKILDQEDYHIEKFLARIENKQDSFYHKDPINLIYEIGVKSIREFDYNTFELVQKNILRFFELRIKRKKQENNTVDVKEVYFNFTKILSDFFEIAVKERNSKFLTHVINSRYSIEKTVLKNLAHKSILDDFSDFDGKYKHWYFNFDCEKYVRQAVKFGEDDICEHIINRFHTLATESIEQLYPNDITYTRENHFEIARKSEIVFEPFTLLSTISEILISNGKNILMKEVFTALYCIEVKVIDIDTPDVTKCFLFHVIHNYKKSIFQIYIESQNTVRINYSNFPFKEGIRIFEKTKCRVSFLGTLEILSILFSNDLTNNVVLNQIKANMLYLIRINEYSNNLFSSAIKKFVELSELIRDTDSAHKKDIYIKLVENLEIVESELTKNENAPEGIKKELNAAINSFKKREKYKKELQSVGFISDERLT